MERTDMIDRLADIRLSRRTNVVNPTRIRQLIVGDLEDLTDADLQRELDHATGVARQRAASPAHELQLAASLASDMIRRTEIREGARVRCFTDSEVYFVLCDNYPPAVAERAVRHALTSPDTVGPVFSRSSS